MYNLIEYEQPIFRPPSEANSLLIQLTIGCSNNGCTYCDMYSSKKYRVRPFAEIKAEIDKIRSLVEKNVMASPNKVFLCDGDALAAPMDILQLTTSALNEAFPTLRRIGIYCTAKNILEKSESDLTLLAENGLNIGYLGLESGSDEILEMVKKGNSKTDMIEASNKLMSSGFKLSVIAMLGLGGTKFSKQHVIETADVISKTTPTFFSFLSTVPIEGTSYNRSLEKGDITALTSKALLQEMYDVIEKIEIEKDNIIFRANHVSNAYPIAGTLPRDKNRILETINKWINETPEGVYPSFPDSL